MVLEALYKIEWLEKRTSFMFVLGIVYAVLGIVAAIILFPQDPALVAVAFISILALPTLYKLFSREVKKEGEERKFSIINLFKDNWSTIKIYLFLSLGIFLVFSFFALVLPSLATNHLFREQIEVMQSGEAIHGGATFSTGLFFELFNNNLRVLIFCFIISLLSGSGAIFLITWNLSVWGTIFGNLAKTAAFTVGKNPLVYFILIMFSVLPHAFLEILSYILASISAGVISKNFLKERFFSLKFRNVLLYNFVLLFLSVIVLLIATVIETYVLNNLELYRTIIIQSFG